MLCVAFVYGNYWFEGAKRGDWHFVACGRLALDFVSCCSINLQHCNCENDSRRFNTFWSAGNKSLRNGFAAKLFSDPTNAYLLTLFPLSKNAHLKNVSTAL